MIASTKPIIDNITNLFPLQLLSTLLVMPMAYSSHTRVEPINFGSKKENLGNATGSQIIPIIIAIVRAIKPMIAE